MTTDLLDEVFLQAAADRQPSTGAIEISHAAAAVRLPSELPPEHQPAGLDREPANPEPAELVADAPARPLRDLLERFPERWSAVVAVVEQAAAAGRRTIAVAGHQQGEGRTTLVQGLNRLLTQRGWQVTGYANAAAWWQELVGDAATWRWRVPPPAEGDRQLVLVDAGIWFPPGPLRPRQLLLTMFGYDAVLLVRHGAWQPCPDRHRLITQAGLEPLGEVVNFAAACPLPGAA